MIHFRQILKNQPLLISLHVLAWSCFLFFPFFVYRIQILHRSFFYKELVDNLFLIGLFYLNIYYLIPRFFNRKKIAVYLVTVILAVLFITIQQAALDFYFFRYMTANVRSTVHVMRGDRMLASGDRIVKMPFRPTQPLADTVSFAPPVYEDVIFARPAMPLPSVNITVHRGSSGMVADEPVARAGFAISGHRKDTIIAVPAIAARLGSTSVFLESPSFFRYLFFPEVLRRSGFFALLMLFMSGFIKIALEWFKSEKQRETLNVEKLNAELKFLKSQINPHFLFNCLNTIYSLAHKQSGQTEHAILKLSTIMRYMIYESNETQVELEKELHYLRDYIDIQRLRLSKEVPVHYEVDGLPGKLMIEPMLLAPFVENAFKHGISYNEASFIHIQILINGGTLRLTVKNSLFKERVGEKGGIGLQNVLKRLDMLYTHEHEVHIQETENQFIVDLKIVLKND